MAARDKCLPGDGGRSGQSAVNHRTMIMDMKPIRRLTASLLRHRAAPWLCALAVLALTSCGDFFEFGDERATWDGKIICQNDSSVVMVGDTMTLSVDFSPPRPDSLSVF